MSVYTLGAIWTAPEPAVESFFHGLQEKLANLK